MTKLNYISETLLNCLQTSFRIGGCLATWGCRHFCQDNAL